MIAIVLAGLSAAIWGIADFSGGKASQRTHPLAVTVVSQVFGLPVLALCLVAVPGVPSGRDIGWGAVAGVCGFLGIVLLYRALSSGAMAVVAPVTAVTAAVIPMAVGLVTDHAPTILGFAGAACAVVAIALVSLGSSGDRSTVAPRLVGLALAAGALFGVFFALLGQASEEAGVWSLAAVRLTSIPFGVLLMLSSRTAWRLPTAVLPWAAVAGTFDIAANALFILATFSGHLSIVAAIASLYPASTVLLALTIDRERIRPWQFVGLALAAAALVLASA